MPYKEPNLYTLLDIVPDSSNLELLLAFTICAHESAPNEQDVNYRRLYLAAIAYSTLSDAGLRKQYDIKLRIGEGQQIEFTLQALFDSLTFLNNFWSYLGNIIKNCGIFGASIVLSYIGHIIMPSELYGHIHMLIYCCCAQVLWDCPTINWRFYLQ